MTIEQAQYEMKPRGGYYVPRPHDVVRMLAATKTQLIRAYRILRWMDKEAEEMEEARCCITCSLINIERVLNALRLGKHGADLRPVERRRFDIFTEEPLYIIARAICCAERRAERELRYLTTCAVVRCLRLLEREREAREAI